jgi:hypothetical protein
MKARIYEDNHGDGERLCYRASSSARAETTAFLTLGLVGAASVVIALVSASLPAEIRKDPVTDVVHYVRSGQVMADVRTMAELVHYLFENDSLGPSNLIEAGPSATNLATPTNIPGVAPRA